MTDPTGVPRNALTPDVGLPARLDMRRACEIYVYGRSRTLAPPEKGSAVAGTVAAPFAGASDAGQATPVNRETVVSVPYELRFDRNAGTWRPR